MCLSTLVGTFLRQARLLGGLALAVILLIGVAACTTANTDPAKMLRPTPTVAALPSDQPVTPPLDSAVALVLDVTSSTRGDYLTGAEALVADALDGWPQPGRGGVELAVTLINSNSYDPVNEVLAGKVLGLPPAPTTRATRPRPAQPDLAPCQKNAFTRAKCEESLVHDYNTALAAALDDERTAGLEHQSAVATQTNLTDQRITEMRTLTDSLRNLQLKTDSRGSDISGGLLRAAEFLNASQAPHKRLIVQSDLDPFGPQQRGALQFDGFEITVVFWDCRESRSCAARKDDATRRFMAAGAASVVFYDPASSRLLTNLLGGTK